MAGLRLTWLAMAMNMAAWAVSLSHAEVKDCKLIGLCFASLPSTKLGQSPAFSRACRKPIADVRPVRCSAPMNNDQEDHPLPTKRPVTQWTMPSAGTKSSAAKDKVSLWKQHSLEVPAPSLNEKKGDCRLFLDTANLNDFTELLPLGIFYGVTTNPLLVRLKTPPILISIPSILAPCSSDMASPHPDFDMNSIDIAPRLLPWAPRSSCARHGGQRSGSGGEENEEEDDKAVQVDELVDNGIRLANFDSRVVVKVPLTFAGIEAASMMSNLGIRVCTTACYSPHQVLTSVSAGAEYVAPYLGRMNDAGRDGMQSVADMQKIVDGMRSKTRVLVASIRDADQLAMLAARGCNTFTISPTVLETPLFSPSPPLASLTNTGWIRLRACSRKMSSPWTLRLTSRRLEERGERRGVGERSKQRGEDRLICMAVGFVQHGRREEIVDGLLHVSQSDEFDAKKFFQPSKKVVQDKQFALVPFTCSTCPRHDVLLVPRPCARPMPPPPSPSWLAGSGAVRLAPPHLSATRSLARMARSGST
eukprot:752456-Hanusia_phi.AAC.3